ncbi:MAG: UrcA family protein [Proteobacteria bacterium]|nr:UrcA family protein [Pseudomonadota bacterium]
MNSLKLNRAATRAVFAATLLTVGATALACDVPTAAAVAAPTAGARTLKVSYRDLDLTTAAGHRTLVNRLNSAARKVCSEDGMRGLDARAASQSCERAALSQALYEVHAAHASTTYAVNMNHN